MSNTTHHSGKGLLGNVENVASLAHGTGEKLRGEFNNAVDNAFHDPQGQAKNAATIQLGNQEIDTGHLQGSGRKQRRDEGVAAATTAPAGMNNKMLFGLTPTASTGTGYAGNAAPTATTNAGYAGNTAPSGTVQNAPVNTTTAPRGATGEAGYGNQHSSALDGGYESTFRQ